MLNLLMQPVYMHDTGYNLYVIRKAGLLQLRIIFLLAKYPDAGLGLTHRWYYATESLLYTW